MSGRRHRVITSIAVKKADTIWQKDCVSIVKMKVLSAAKLTPICPQAIGRAKQADTVSKVPQGRLCHGSGILFRNHGFACGGNLCAVKRGWHFNIRSDMMKGRQILLDHMNDRQAAALVEDGKLQDLF